MITALHYTSNRESEHFSSKIRENILKLKGDIPLISVSQKPLSNFGENICVGVHDNCYFNMCRQIQIGLKHISTPFTLLVEGDFLYSPEYFTFTPSELHSYYYDNVWVLYDKSPPNRFHFKGRSTGAGIIPTKQWLEKVTALFKGKHEWRMDSADDFEPPFDRPDPRFQWTGNPVITFKTKNQINSNTRTKGTAPKYSLPYWGHAQKLKEAFLYSET